MAAKSCSKPEVHRLGLLLKDLVTLKQASFEVRSLGERTFDSKLDACRNVEDHERVFIDPNLDLSATDVETARCTITVERAGPRRKLFFDPKETSVAIVTCGGLCPGLNNVIRALTLCLHYRFGVKRILGIRYGYAGLVKGGTPPIELTPQVVNDLMYFGGTFLGTSRGNQPAGAMVDFLVENDIDILFTIGGDGTLRGALTICNELEKRGLAKSVIGIPKTIDNDILWTDRSFGFDTAVAAAEKVIHGAHAEAVGHENGVGLVKLMGRESGFIALQSSIASGEVNLTLLPEVSFCMDTVLKWIEERLRTRRHIMIVVAEGAGQEYVTSVGTDKSGNAILGDIGLFLKDKIGQYLKAKNISHTVKYIDPSYVIRSTPAITTDAVYCLSLAQMAVHAGLAGKTALMVGQLNGNFVHIPMEQATKRRKQVDPWGMDYQCLLDSTGMPESLK